MKFKEGISTVDKISLMERYILVHSMVYYTYNYNIIEDSQYDKEQRILAKAIKKFPNEFKKSRFYKTFKNFDGSTGYDLCSRCFKLQREEHLKIRYIAAMLMDGHETQR